MKTSAIATAENASVTLYTETLSKNPQVCAGKTRRFRWGKTPSDVTSRRDISYSAKVLLDAFSQHGNGMDVIALSQVFLADAIGGERGTVATALASLERAGLIAKAGIPSGHDQIQAYRMMHPAMVRRKVEAQEIVRKPKFSQCSTCGALKVLGVSTVCRKCVRNTEIKRLAENTAVRVVHEELAKKEG